MTLRSCFDMRLPSTFIAPLIPDSLLPVNVHRRHGTFVYDNNSEDFHTYVTLILFRIVVSFGASNSRSCIAPLATSLTSTTHSHFISNPQPLSSLRLLSAPFRHLRHTVPLPATKIHCSLNVYIRHQGFWRQRWSCSSSLVPRTPSLIPLLVSYPVFFLQVFTIYANFDDILLEDVREQRG